MQLVWAERSYPITGGFTLSVLFHVLLALLIILGVPSFYKVEVLPQPQGIEATIVSDITAAPKVDKEGKAPDKPKPPQPPAPEQTKLTPPKPPTPATPTQATPPPQAAPQEAVAIPDETQKKTEEQKKVEPKPEEKKSEKKPEDKPKKNQQDNDFNKLLADLTKTPAAPDTKQKPKPNAKAAPAEPTVGPKTTLLTDGPPMTASDNDAIRQQLIPCWNFDAGVPNPENYTVTVRITLREDGAITGAEVEDASRLNDPTYYAVAQRAMDAVQNPSCQPLHLPQGKFWPQIDVVFDLAKAINGGY